MPSETDTEPQDAAREPSREATKEAASKYVKNKLAESAKREPQDAASADARRAAGELMLVIGKFGLSPEVSEIIARVLDSFAARRATAMQERAAHEMMYLFRGTDEGAQAANVIRAIVIGNNNG